MEKGSIMIDRMTTGREMDKYHDLVDIDFSAYQNGQKDEL
jgi:hypothetical protein